MKKFDLILDTILVIIFAITLIVNLIAGAWLFVALDGVCVILGVVNICLICRDLKREKERDKSGEDLS